MHQFAVCTALEQEGLGANLQHYNPLIDARVAAEWGVPEDWELSAQLVFGNKTGRAEPKNFEGFRGEIQNLWRIISVSGPYRHIKYSCHAPTTQGGLLG